jgi:hypothetical protein
MYTWKYSYKKAISKILPKTVENGYTFNQTLKRVEVTVYVEKLV